MFQILATPSISQILPQTIAAGSPALMMKVTGTNFTSKAVILWNGNALATTVIDSNTLSGTVGSSIVAAPATVQLKVQNSETGQESAAVPLVVASSSSSSTLAISTTQPPSATVGVAYSAALAAAGGTPAYTWSVSTGQLPPGLSLAAATGIISGIPASSGIYSFGVTATDSSSPVETSNAALTISVAAVAQPATPLSIVSSALPSGTQGLSYSAGLQVSGGTAPYSWSITSGSLPAGLTLATATGIVSGTPTTSGTSSFTATVTDVESPAQSKSATISLSVTAASLTLATTLPNATDGTGYSAGLQVSGGTGPYSWSITSGSLPAGLTLATTTGVVSGTPTTSGTSSFTATVTDAESPAQSKSATISLSIALASLTLSTTLPDATDGTGYSAGLQVSGGTPAYTWSIPSGSLPAGLTMSATTGVISGTPSATGTSNFTVMVTDNNNPAQTKSAATSIVVAAQQSTGPGTTWYIRTDGGTRYSSNVPTGQCDGKADVAYPGSGTNQRCAFNDFRYLYDDNSGATMAWVIAGGDTVIIRGCAALPGQQNPSNPDCRVGWDQPTGSGLDSRWCYGVGSYGCYNPPIPAGSASQHTRILGQNYAACNTGGATNPKLYAPNLTQIFGGFSVLYTLNLENTSNVDIQCLEITSHNGACVTIGAPQYPRGCATSQPLDDYAISGILNNNATSNVTLQDVYIHGFNSSGLFGPIGGPITMTRMFVGFNAFAGWNFDDGYSTPDAPGSTITATHVIMEGNGCQEQYPLTNAFPAMVCYDTNSAGFGDSWSGQNTALDSMICDDCQNLYNTKDGFIGPHTWITTLVIENSVSIGNMGQDWKWGGNATPNNTTFLNNLTVGNCNRMSQPLPGAPSNYNQYLTGFCRAAGNVVASVIPAGSTWLIANSTWVTYQPTMFDIACPGLVTGACTSTVNFTNNVFLGYKNPSQPDYSGEVPGLYYIESSSINVVSSHNVEFGVRNDDCPNRGTGNICSDPLLVGEPAQGTVPPESTLDNFNFHLTSNSPAIGGGATYSALPSTDYFGTATSNPPAIGAVGP